jgi:cold shock CspA family protein
VLGTLKKVHGGNGFCYVDGVADDVLLGSRSLHEAGINLATMQIGDNLAFEMAMGSRGYHAINIQQVVPHQWSHVGRRVVGTLKKTHGSNGFCSVEGVPDDVLVGSRSLKDCGIDLETIEVGEFLTFEMAMGPKGYHAIDIQQHAVKRHGGKRVVGMLKKVNRDNGFCSVEGVAEDVLLGSRSLNESGVNLETLLIGDFLTFEMAMGPKGYNATNIRRSKRFNGRLKTIQGSMGFCTVDGVSGDVLLGQRSLSDSGVYLESLQIGDTLSFEMARGPKGYHAINIEQGPYDPDLDR